jgi:hypothetical protein
VPLAPRLDDRSFEQLALEGRSLIPRHTREWTNHNPSDPGITLLELFAYLTEALVFQLDQVPEATLERLLRLAGTCRVGPATAKEPIDQAVRRALNQLEASSRAVTAAEFEALAERVPLSPGLAPVARAKLVRMVDERCTHPAPHPGEPVAMAVLVVVPDDPASDRPAPTPAMLAELLSGLQERRILTTRLHVVGPAYVGVRVEAVVVRRPGSGLTAAQVAEAIAEFLHPLRGGPDGRGWPFGRTVYRSELLQRLESLAPVDHVDRLVVGVADAAVGAVREEGVDLPEAALVHAPPAGIDVRVQDTGPGRA